MHRTKKSLSIVMTICALICWWGYFFPQLTLTPDTVQVIDTSGAQAPAEKQRTDLCDYDDLYYQLLTAEPGKIRIRCQLFTTLSSYWEALKNGSN